MTNPYVHVGGTGGVETSEEMQQYLAEQLDKNGLLDVSQSMYLDKKLESKKEVDEMVERIVEIIDSIKTEKTE